MADPQVLTTLRRKQDEIENAIAAYEKRAEEARRDLAAINAAIRIFDVNPKPSMSPPTWMYTGYSNVENRLPSARPHWPQRAAVHAGASPTGHAGEGHG